MRLREGFEIDEKDDFESYLQWRFRFERRDGWNGWEREMRVLGRL